MTDYRAPVLTQFEWQEPVLDKDLTAPPGGESKGDRYIVGASATGAWSGEDGNIATYNGSGWDFTDKKEGMKAYVKDEDVVYEYITSWLSTKMRGFCFMVHQSDDAVVVADGKVGFPVPLDMNGMDLVYVLVGVYDKGITGSTNIQIRRRRAGSNVDALSTQVTIGDEWYAADGVINTSNDDLNTGDLWFADVKQIHSGTAPNGLYVVCMARKQ